MLRVEFPQLHPLQETIADSPARFRVVSAGRRWGKSLMAGDLAVGAALGGGKVWWVGPTYPLTTAAWRDLKATARQIPGTEISESTRTLIFPTGGLLEVKSADNPDSLRGVGLDFLVIDEAAFVAEEAWTEALRPTLADRQGRALIISTPKGRNWFWRAFQLGQDASQDEWRSWQAPTSSSPYIASTELAAAKAGLPERVWRQEFLADFLEDGGSVFRGVRTAASARVLTHAEPGRRYVMGVDWGKTEDFTVITVIDDETGEVVRVDRFNQIDYTVQRGRVVSAFEAFHPATVVVERNSIGEPLIEELVRSGLPVQPFTTSNASKSLIIDALALAFERGDVRIPDDPSLLAELEAFEMERLPGGSFRYAAPSGMHDDMVMSLAFAWHAHAGSGIPFGGFLKMIESDLRAREVAA